MTNKLKALFLLLTANCLLPTISFSQDIHFSQYNFSPLTLNPALTSAYKDIQATLHYKDQWNSMNAYKTASATFEIKLGQPNWVKVDRLTGAFKQKLAKGLAFGLNAFSDKAGDGKMKQTQANLSIAYHARLNEHNTLSAGLMGGFGQRSIVPEGLRWNNQYASGSYDPTISSGENFSKQSFVYGDYNMGLLWSYGDASRYATANDQKHINAGISLGHLNSPGLSFVSTDAERLDWKWTAHANSLIGIKNSLYSVGPSILFMQQGPLREITFGALVKYKFKEESKYTGYVRGAAISAGCYYRNKDAVIPYLLLEVDAYSLGLSYDTNISGLKTATAGRGGFEITLRFNTPSSFLFQTKSRI